MSKNERHVFIGVMLVLAAALAVMLYQNVWGNGQAEIRRVSVLLDGESESYWQNFRLGVDRAAREHNVDVRYVFRYDGPAGTAQAEQLRREWEGELDGVILVPVDADVLAETLQEAPDGLAVTVVGPALSGVEEACTISASPEEMGRQLATAVADSGAASCAVVLTGREGETALRRLHGLEEGFQELGVAWCTVMTLSVEALPEPDGQPVVALEPGTTEALCARGGPVYGIGASNGILSRLEEGTAAALVVQSDYDAGYLSLLSVLESLNGVQPEDQILDCYTVTAENMFTDPMDQILFPVA